jgi:hypothetical protein
MADVTPRPTDPDWADQAADTVVRVVDSVRQKTTGPVLTGARAVVYGIIGLFGGVVALIVLTIALVRVVDILIPGDVWSAYLVIGAVFLLLGGFVWSKREAPTPA